MKSLPKAYEPKKYEGKIYEKWEKSDCFNPDKLKLPKNAKNYSIVMPPPNVTGTLHLGHAAMLAIEDLLIRFHRMKGLRTLWIPGTDHAAIATQTKVEKILKSKENKTRHDLGRKEFLKMVEGFAQESHDTIVNQVKKMGCSCDWGREAYTLDEIRTKSVRSVFKMMYDDGLIYRGKRIVNWCPRCHSTLADDEVEYEKEIGKLYWLKYGPFTLATARPETKLGDTAVAVYPGDKRYKNMVGKKYKIPGVLGKFEITVVADKAVDPKFGSGAIKVTPAHDFTDFEIAQRHGIGMKQIIDENGKMMENCEKYAGMTTKEARKAIVADMKKLGLIDYIDDNYEHNIAVCYRCGTQIEPIPSLQWFIDVNKKIKRLGGKSIKQISIDSVKKGVFKNKPIKIIPKRFEKIYYNWMNNLRDWCISRQIWYGHQIPVWYKNNKVYVGTQPPKSNGWKQDPDTLDTWFSSGLWTFSTLARDPKEIKIGKNGLEIKSRDFEKFHPTSVLETGYDILFFWVARMIIMSTYAVGSIPFKDVYLHGLVLDEKGKKMSKSKGNVIDPLDMANKYGTDAVRLSLLIGSTPGNDLRLSEEKIEGFRNFANKLWNIARFIISSSKLPHLPANRKVEIRKLDTKKLSLADKWILGKLNKLTKEITIDLENYQFSSAGEKLREFTWNDFADWYVEISKIEKNKDEILFFILDNLLRLWHPFIPFVTEKIYEEIFPKKLLMVEKWPIAEKYRSEAKTEKEFASLQKIIIKIRNLRTDYKIPPATIISAIAKNIGHQKAIEKLARVKISEKPITEKRLVIISAGNIKIGLDIAGIIDVEKEKRRLGSEIKNLENVAARTKALLENEGFMKKAPKEVIVQNRDKLKEYQNKLKIQKGLLKNLS